MYRVYKRLAPRPSRTPMINHFISSDAEGRNPSLKKTAMIRQIMIPANMKNLGKKS